MSRLRRSLAVLVLVALGLAVVAVLAARFLPPRQTEQVEVPAASATPAEVVRAYVRALNAHDCETAEALSTHDFATTAGSWCHDLAALDRVAPRPPSVMRPQDAGRSAGEHVVNLSVTFDLDWRLFHGDITMPEGRTLWGYDLVRESRSAPWRIYDNGVG